MLMVTICEAYCWTYDEYVNQPLWFITLIKEKMVRDNKERELANKRINRGY